MAKQVIPENDILRAEQLRILRAAGVDRVDERIRHLLATGRLSAGAVLTGYGRLMRDLYTRKTGVVALAVLGLALVVGCSDEEAALPLDAGTVATSATATTTGTGATATLPTDSGSPQTATATSTGTGTTPTVVATGTRTSATTGAGTGTCKDFGLYPGQVLACNQKLPDTTWICMCHMPCGTTPINGSNCAQGQGGMVPSVIVRPDGTSGICECRMAPS